MDILEEARTAFTRLKEQTAARLREINDTYCLGLSRVPALIPVDEPFHLAVPSKEVGSFPLRICSDNPLAGEKIANFIERAERHYIALAPGGERKEDRVGQRYDAGLGCYVDSPIPGTDSVIQYLRSKIADIFRPRDNPERYDRMEFPPKWHEFHTSAFYRYPEKGRLLEFEVRSGNPLVASCVLEPVELDSLIEADKAFRAGSSFESDLRQHLLLAEFLSLDDVCLYSREEQHIFPRGLFRFYRLSEQALCLSPIERYGLILSSPAQALRQVASGINSSVSEQLDLDAVPEDHIGIQSQIFDFFARSFGRLGISTDELCSAYGFIFSQDAPKNIMSNILRVAPRHLRLESCFGDISRAFAMAYHPSNHASVQEIARIDSIKHKAMRELETKNRQELFRLNEGFYERCDESQERRLREIATSAEFNSNWLYLHAFLDRHMPVNGVKTE